jgi:chemotaxis protein CheD
MLKQYSLEHDMEIVNIHAGEIYVAEKPSSIVTLLGSCIAVCLWDSVTKIGGMNHYLLPFPLEKSGSASLSGNPDHRYGNMSIETMIQRLFFAGARKERMVAKVFGGGEVIYNDGIGRPLGRGVGKKNLEIAESMLNAIGIPIIAKDTGGRDGRKILFRTDTGQVTVRKLHIEKLNETTL